MTALASYEQALPLIAAKYPRPDNARLPIGPKEIVNPALAKWKKETGK